MIVTIAGTNGLVMTRRLSELVAKFKSEHGELAIERIDASEAENGAVLAAVSSLPFLSDRKLVIVRGLGSNKTEAEQIEQIISSISETNDLILYETTTDKRSSFYKYLKSKTQFEEYGEMEASALVKWLVGEAQKMNVKLSQADASYLVDRLGINQAALANELEKLAIYNSEISPDSINLLTEKTPQSRVFDLLDAAFAGNVKRALELYEEQRAQKVEPQTVLALLVWQMHLISVAKAAKNKAADEIAREANVSPYPLNKAKLLANKISAAQLRQRMSELAEIDYKNKTVYLDLDEALKSYLSTL